MSYPETVQHIFLPIGIGGYQCYGFSKKKAEEKDGELSMIEGRENYSIYIYLGHSGQNGPKDFYVGQTTRDWLKRVTENHETEGEDVKDWREKYWEYTFVFTPAREGIWDDQCLNYLEHTFHCNTREAGRYKVIGKKTPDIKRSDLDEDIAQQLDDFILSASYWLKNLGFNFFLDFE